MERRTQLGLKLGSNGQIQKPITGLSSQALLKRRFAFGHPRSRARATGTERDVCLLSGGSSDRLLGRKVGFAKCGFRLIRKVSIESMDNRRRIAGSLTIKSIIAFKE